MLRPNIFLLLSLGIAYAAPFNTPQEIRWVEVDVKVLSLTPNAAEALGKVSPVGLEACKAECQKNPECFAVIEASVSIDQFSQVCSALTKQDIPSTKSEKSHVFDFAKLYLKQDKQSDLNFEDDLNQVEVEARGVAALSQLLYDPDLKARLQEIQVYVVKLDKAELRMNPIPGYGGIPGIFAQVDTSTPLQEMPPQALTGATSTISGLPYGNGDYVVTSSSFFNTAEANWRAFDKVIYTGGSSTSMWTSSSWNLYTKDGFSGSFATVVDGEVVRGEWLQIKLPQSFVLSSFLISTREGATGRAPQDFIIAGSKDGITWTAIERKTNVTNWNSTVLRFTVTNSSNVDFDRFRLCVSKLVAPNYLRASGFVPSTNPSALIQPRFNPVQSFVGTNATQDPFVCLECFGSGLPAASYKTGDVTMQLLPLPPLISISASREISCGIQNTTSRLILCSRDLVSWYNVSSPVPFNQLVVDSGRACAVDGNNLLWCTSDILSKFVLWLQVNTNSIRFRQVDLSGNMICGRTNEVPNPFVRCTRVDFANMEWGQNLRHWFGIWMSITDTSYCGMNMEDPQNVYCGSFRVANWGYPNPVYPGAAVMHSDFSGRILCAIQRSSGGMVCSEGPDHRVWTNQMLPNPLDVISLFNGQPRALGLANGSTWLVQNLGYNVPNANSDVLNVWRANAYFVQASTSDYVTCAISVRNDLWCSADGTSNWVKQPQIVATYVAIDNTKVCVIDTVAEVWCKDDIYSSDPWENFGGPSAPRFQQIDLSYNVLCGVNLANQVICGSLSANPVLWKAPQSIQTNSFRQISLNGERACGLPAATGAATDRRLHCTRNIFLPGSNWQSIDQVIARNVSLRGDYQCVVEDFAGTTKCRRIGTSQWNILLGNMNHGVFTTTRGVAVDASGVYYVLRDTSSFIPINTINELQNKWRRIDLSLFKQVSASRGYFHSCSCLTTGISCAISTLDKLYCSGPDGRTGWRLRTDVQIPFIQISVDASGRAYGLTSNSQIYVTSNMAVQNPVWTNIATNNAFFRQIDFSGNNVCGATEENVLLCSSFSSGTWSWYGNFSFAKVFMSSNITCGFSSWDGSRSAWCFEHGQLGQLAGVPNSFFSSMDIGGNRLCGVDANNGKIRCATYGQWVWSNLPGAFDQVSVGEDVLYAIDRNHFLYYYAEK